MECGNCTACCTMFPIGPIDKPMNTRCQHSTGSACSIYDTKPKMCTEFMCAYLQGGNNEELRPDKCGIIFVKKTDKIFSGILVDGVEVTDIAKQQIQAFNNQGFSVVLLSVNEKEQHIMPAEGYTKDGVYSRYKEAISGDL